MALLMGFSLCVYILHSTKNGSSHYKAPKKDMLAPRSGTKKIWKRMGMGIRGKGKERTFLERFFLPLPPVAGGA
jgi:hypothetical protein